MSCEADTNPRQRTSRIVLAAGCAVLAVVAGCTSSGDAAPAKLAYSDAGQLSAVLTSRLNAARQCHVTIDLAVAGKNNVKAEGGYRHDSDGPSVRLTIASTGGPLTMIATAGRMHLGEGAEGPWTEVREDGSDPASKQYGSVLASLRDDIDVAATADDLKAAGTITGNAAETAGGRALTRYSVDLDVAKLIATEADAADRKELQTAYDNGLKKFSVKLLLDVDDTLLEVQEGLILPSGPVTPISTVVYSAWGTPTDITAPTPS